MTATPPTPPILGMYETNGNFPTPGASAWPSGPTTNMSATYQAWGQDWATYGGAFVNECNSNGLLPFVELEPWNSGENWNVTPLFTDITDGSWDSWLEGIGTAIAATGKPCMLTFAHEMNVSGQYPWSHNDTGSGPGGGTLSPAEWILGWNYVVNKVNSTAGGYAIWIWACSAWTGGTTTDPTPWWPGSNGTVDMVGIDGYPTTAYNSPGNPINLGTFSGQIQQTVTAIRNLGWTDPIFLSETNLAQMVASGGESITDFVTDMYNSGMSGMLEFEDAGWDLPQMSPAQWTEYNAAVAALYTGGGGGGGGVSPPPPPPPADTEAMEDEGGAALEDESGQNIDEEGADSSGGDWEDESGALLEDESGEPLEDESGGGGGVTVTETYTLWEQAPETWTDTSVYEATAAVEFSVSEAATLGGLWLYSPSGQSITGLPSKIALYNASSQALIDSQTASWSGAAGSGWVYAAFTSPPPLAASTDYMAAIFGAAGTFGYDSSFSWPVSNGPVTGVDGGFYSLNTSLSYPADQESGWNWWIDPSVSVTTTTGGGSSGGGGTTTGTQWTIQAITPGSQTLLGTYTGNLTNISVGYVSDVYCNPSGGITDDVTSAGWLTVQTYADDLTAISPVLAGYAGETSADRLGRLCGEEGIGFEIIGSDTDTPQMGPQQDDTLVNVLQSCEDADRGLLFESRDQLGLTYRTRISMCGQSPAAVYDWAGGQIASPPPQPVTDDQYTRNDITLTRSNGASVTVQQLTGPMSISDPPNGTGDYTYSLTTYLFADSQLANMAAWMLGIGTVSAARYPSIAQDLSRADAADLMSITAGLEHGDWVQLINPPNQLTPGPIDQLVYGWTETLNAFKWQFSFNMVPESPYSSGPQVINLNTSFADGDKTGWSVGGGTITVTGAPPAGCPTPYALQLTPSGSTTFCEAQETGYTFPCAFGQQIIVNAHVYAEGTSDVEVGCDWLDANGDYLSTTVLRVPPVAGQWVPLSVTVWVAYTAVSGYVRVGRNGVTSNASSGDVIYTTQVEAIYPINVW